ncbi:MAG: ribonuclease P protein component [Firmicutes bacterium]|nr:ribonuclease P protein component [Bacillota bacterium]
MKKINVVKESRDFQTIIENGQSVRNKNYIIYYKKNELSKYRFGLSVGKKIGNAVVRNKYKRQLRNIIDHHTNMYQKNIDYIIIVRKNCLNESYSELEESLVQLMNKINSK